MGKNQKIAAAAGVLVFAIGIVCLMFTVRAHKKREIVLEFGMFTGSNWGVESATSFVIIDKAIERFEQEHPGVKIHYYSGVLKEDYPEWFARKLLKGEVPDVFMVLSDDFKQYCSLGVMKDLSGLMEQDAGFDTEKFYDTALRAGEYGGRQYALPYEVVPTLIFVNKTLLNREGLTSPSADWTWEDLYQICKAVTKDTDHDGKLDRSRPYAVRTCRGARAECCLPVWFCAFRTECESGGASGKEGRGPESDLGSARRNPQSQDFRDAAYTGGTDRAVL